MKYCSCTSIQSLWIQRYLKIIIKGELLTLEIVNFTGMLQVLPEGIVLLKGNINGHCG